MRICGVSLIQNMVSREISQSLMTMPWGTHAMLVYDTQENKRDVLFSHLKLGAGKNRLVYVGTEEEPSAIRSEMNEFGVDVEGLEKNGDLSVKNYDEVYIVDGEVDASRIISGFSELSDDARRSGKEGIRASAEMSCFLRARKVDELVDYERALDPVFNFPGKGICGYSLLEMEKAHSLEILWPVIKAHSLVIMTGPRGSFALKQESVNRDLVETTMGIEA